MIVNFWLPIFLNHTSCRTQLLTEYGDPSILNDKTVLVTQESTATNGVYRIRVSKDDISLTRESLENSKITIESSGNIWEIVSPGSFRIIHEGNQENNLKSGNMFTVLSNILSMEKDIEDDFVDIITSPRLRYDKIKDITNTISSQKEKISLLEEQLEKERSTLVNVQHSLANAQHSLVNEQSKIESLIRSAENNNDTIKTYEKKIKKLEYDNTRYKKRLSRFAESIEVMCDRANSDKVCVIFKSVLIKRLGVPVEFESEGKGIYDTSNKQFNILVNGKYFISITGALANSYDILISTTKKIRSTQAYEGYLRKGDYFNIAYTGTTIPGSNIYVELIRQHRLS